ncbi:MAG: hypothetical protein LBN05_07680 [Oscillospiraceae bacterium]|jgi:multidrug efflux pump subunit AcrA (membrane-fusion protein)|nr:hypothetical protein [Oscillospiraceae bacterium]
MANKPKDKKKSKKRLLTALAIVLVVGLLGGWAWLEFKPEPPLEVAYSDASTGNITQLLDKSGTVVAENHGNFDVLNGMKTLEVKVKVGERVTAGQVLATFDESTLNSELSEKQAAYDVAQKTYKNALASTAEAKKTLEENKARLAEIEKQLEEQAAVAAAAALNPTTAAPTPSLPESLLNTIRDLLGGDISSVLKGVSSVTSLLGGGSALGFDMSALTGSMGSSSLEMEKMQLQLTQTLAETQASGTLNSVYKNLVDTAKAALEETQAVINQARGGWLAETDGIVREINVVPGEVFENKENAAAASSTLDLSSVLALVQGGGQAGLSDMLAGLLGGTGKTFGLSLEYYPFTADVLMDVADIGNLFVGQEAIIKTRGGDIAGKVSYISAVAESSSGGLDIGSLLGSGGSASSGVPVKISITAPNEHVFINDTVNLSIPIKSAENAVLLPFEAVQRDEHGYYVWLYNGEGTIARHSVELGMRDSTQYEILSGLTDGQRVVRTLKEETRTITDGARVQFKVFEDQNKQ